VGSKDRQGILWWELEAVERKLVHQVTLTQEGDKKIARLQKGNDEATSQLAEMQKYCRDLVAAGKVNTPDICFAVHLVCKVAAVLSATLLFYSSSA
jgi:hypothetical protein